MGGTSPLTYLLGIVLASGIIALWLFVRQRSGLSYLLVLAPLVLVPLAITLFRLALLDAFRDLAYELQFSHAYWIVGAVGSGVYLSAIVIPVWIARLWEPSLQRRAAERASLRAVDGAQASSEMVMAPSYPGTNTLAILAIVFAFVFSPLGVIFGHVARGQIRHSGEQGGGLALAGLVLGYISLALGVMIVIAYFAFMGWLYSSSLWMPYF